MRSIKFVGAPHGHLLFGLRQALDPLFEEEMENAFRRHRLPIPARRHAVEIWPEGQR